jgi:hypothetical protein
MSEAKNKRQQIVEAVDAGLKTIRKANNYKSDLGLNVYEWRDEPVPDDRLPACTWRDTDEVVSDTSSFLYHAHELVVSIELLAGTEDAPAQLRILIADVVTMIGANLTWDGLAADTRPETESIRTEREGKRIAGAVVTFRIYYETDRFNAYT